MFNLIYAAIALTSFVSAKPDDQVRKHFKSDNYTVTWDAPRTFDPTAELEIGDGSGHGFTLGWLRFLPGPAHVSVLSIQFEDDRKQYRSKWPPDLVPVVVKRSQMKLDAYAALLRDLAVLDAAKLKPVEKNSGSSSSSDFWVYVRLATKTNTLMHLNWAGYESSLEEVNYAKPQAAVALATDAIKGLNFNADALTAEERSWASAKFVRDWKTFKDQEFHWWVKERYIPMIGVVGDATALPTLRDILENDPKDRCVYHSINAITRLTKKDVRDKPVEEMDVEKTRQKVLEMLRDRK